MSETKRIHFTPDWIEEDGPFDPYRCKRCGTTVSGTQSCYEHRNAGLISPCFRKRLKQRLGLSTTDTDQGGSCQ